MAFTAVFFFNPVWEEEWSQHSSLPKGFLRLKWCFKSWYLKMSSMCYLKPLSKPSSVCPLFNHYKAWHRPEPIYRKSYSFLFPWPQEHYIKVYNRILSKRAIYKGFPPPVEVNGGSAQISQLRKLTKRYKVTWHARMSPNHNNLTFHDHRVRLAL